MPDWAIPVVSGVLGVLGAVGVSIVNARSSGRQSDAQVAEKLRDDLVEINEKQAQEIVRLKALAETNAARITALERALETQARDHALQISALQHALREATRQPRDNNGDPIERRKGPA